LRFACAGTNYFVSPFEPPFVNPESAIQPQAGQGFNLWSSYPRCTIVDYIVEPETAVVVEGSEVRVFNRLGQGGELVCLFPGSPAPPVHVSIADINGLAEGNYNLSIYDVPFEDAFPPAAVDYLTYLVTSFQFAIVGAPAAVDSTTNMGLAVLISLMLLLGLKVNRSNWLND